jgi:hypothetical protein
MQFQKYVTADGFPGVTWEQEVPTGETEYSRTQEITWKLSLLIGLLAFGAMLGGGWDLGTALGVGVAVGLVIAAADNLRTMRFNIQGVTIEGQPKTEAEREVERRSKVTRLYRRERRWAEVRFDAQNKLLLLMVLQGATDARQVIYEVLLESFEEMELSTDQEWFGDIGGRELAQDMRQGSAWVIVAQAGEHGVLMIARSARDKASMAHLHQVLRSEFIAPGKRRALQAKAEELASKL